MSQNLVLSIFVDFEPQFWHLKCMEEQAAIIISRSASNIVEKGTSLHVKGIKLCLTAEGLLKFTVNLDMLLRELSTQEKKQLQLVF